MPVLLQADSHFVSLPKPRHTSSLSVLLLGCVLEAISFSLGSAHPHSHISHLLFSTPMALGTWQLCFSKWRCHSVCMVASGFVHGCSAVSSAGSDGAPWLILVSWSPSTVCTGMMLREDTWCIHHHPAAKWSECNSEPGPLSQL